MTGRLTGRVLELAGRAYEAVEGPDSLAGIVGEASALLSCTDIAISQADGRGRFHPLAMTLTLTDNATYFESWFDRDDRMRRFLRATRARRGAFLSNADIYTAAEISGSPIYAEFLHHRGQRDFLDTSWLAGGREVFLVAGLPERANTRRRETVECLGVLATHLVRAALAQARAEAMSAVRAALLHQHDAAGLGVVLLDPDLAIIAHNRCARLHLSASLDLDGAVLRARAPEGGELVARLATGPDGAPTRLAAPGRATPILVETSAVEGGRTMLVSRELSTALDVPISHLLALGLTAAEARIAALLSAGASPSAIACSTGLSIATVRWTLSVIYQKLGVSGQTELVAILSWLRRVRPDA